MHNDTKVLAVTSAVGALLAIALGCSSFLAPMNAASQTVCLVATGFFAMAALYQAVAAIHNAKIRQPSAKAAYFSLALRVVIMVTLIVFGAVALSNSSLSPYARMALGAGVVIPFLFLFGQRCLPRQELGQKVFLDDANWRQVIGPNPLEGEPMISQEQLDKRMAVLAATYGPQQQPQQ